MALTLTSLNGAILQGARQARLTAFTNPQVGPIGPQVLLVIDGEQCYMSDAINSPVLGITRGENGTAAAPHNGLAPVVYGLTSDFTQANGASLAGASVSTYSVNSTITNPTGNALVFITKAGVCALTLTDPAVDQMNTVRFVSLTANAHTITYATGFYDNTTTSDVATFPATAGAALTLVAQGGKWRPVATADDGVLIG